MATPAILAMLAVPAPSTGASGDGCARRIAAAVRTAAPERVPGRCWRLGPLALGMTQSAVGRALGPPRARLASGDHVDALYVFPARPGPIVTGGRARLRLVQLRYRDDRLVLIDTDPGSVSRIEPRRCSRDPGLRVDTSAIAGPALRLAGIGIGDPIHRTRTRFGALPARNRSHDWYSYLPVPIGFGVDPGDDRITGIAIARDERTLTGERAAVHVLVHAGPDGCALTGVDVALVD